MRNFTLRVNGRPYHYQADSVTIKLVIDLCRAACQKRNTSVLVNVLRNGLETGAIVERVKAP